MTARRLRFTMVVCAASLSSALAAEEPWTHHYYTVSDGTKLHYVEMGRAHR